MAESVMDKNFQIAVMRGKRFLFTEERVEEVPEGFYKYEIRHSDEDDDVPIEIAEHVTVNFFGTLIGLEPIEKWDFDDDPCIMLRTGLDPEWYRDQDDCLTDDEFDPDGNENRPVYYPLESELDIDYSTEVTPRAYYAAETKKFTVIVHYEGAYDCEVEAASEEEARKKAEKLFNEAELTDILNNNGIDYKVCDCWEEK